MAAAGAGGPTGPGGARGVDVRSNRPASEAACPRCALRHRRDRLRVCGHLREMAAASGLEAVMQNAGRVPALPGALERAAAGHAPGGAARNAPDFLAPHVEFDPAVPEPVRTLLVDPPDQRRPAAGGGALRPGRPAGRPAAAGAGATELGALRDGPAGASAASPLRPRRPASAMWVQRRIALRPRARGVHLVTRELVEALPELADLEVGLAHLFIQHTSASLALNENASPDVRTDLEAWLDHAVPDGTPYFRHTLEGPDDMPAHVKAVVVGESLTLPIARGRLELGIWQGVLPVRAPRLGRVALGRGHPLGGRRLPAATGASLTG